MARWSHPVAYYGRKLSPAERNYSAMELEDLAVMAAAIQTFSVYLYGVHFTVEMDLRALSFLQSAKHLNGRLARWALQLQNFNFTIQYCPSSSNMNADDGTYVL